jgi:hypothetical protein
MVKPTADLEEILKPHNIKMCLFVDAGYLVRLKEFYTDFPELKKEYDLIVNQLRELSINGHEIQLHIHPHWEDCFFENEGWSMDLTRYRLDQFSDVEICDIVKRYHAELAQISVSDITTYRAGGWSVPPFNKVSNIFTSLGIKIDSTVFKGGQYSSPFQKFDFLPAPADKSKWTFSKNPAVEDVTGEFLEVPIANLIYQPIFYWRLAFTKLLKQSKHKPYGNGFAVKNEGSHLLKMLFTNTKGVVSMDGFKSSVLHRAYQYYEKKQLEDFVIIGHPKAFTPYSLKTFKRFIKRVPNSDFKTYKFYLKN